MKVYLGADHGGFQMKETIKKSLAEWGYDFEDMGNTAFDSNDDYPQYAHSVAAKVAEKPAENRGILLCRSGIGMDIVANKVNGIRSAQVFTEEMARKSREHNDANVLSIATDYLSEESVLAMIKTWLVTPFSKEERHERRLKQIEEMGK